MKLDILFYLLAFRLIGKSVVANCPVGCDCEKKKDAVTVDCHWRNLRGVPRIPCNADEVNLRTNYITRLLRKSFSCHTQMSVLLLSENNLKYIEEDAFENLMKLMFIDLESNQLQNIPYLGSLPSLAHISIMKNFLVEWPLLYLSNPSERQPLAVSLAYNKLQGAPKVLFKIQELDLEGNCITDLSTSMFQHLEAVLDLNIDENNVEYLDKLPKMTNLKELSLKSNHVRSIADSFFTVYLPSLRKINLSRNKIVEVSSFCNMMNITAIFLMENSIRYIHPPAFTNIPNIYVIELSGNNIVYCSSYSFFTIPVSLILHRNKMISMEMSGGRNDSELKYLNVDDNNLYNISIQEFPNLYFLFSSNNFIKDVVFSTYGHRNLQYMNLCQNRIISVSHFGELPMLKWLLLCHNYLQSWDGKNLISSMQLLALDLSHNRISVLTNFTALPELKRLDLSGNILRTMGNATFNHLPSLKSLNLSQNEISSLGFLNSMTSLVTLSLSHNQIRSLDPQDFLNLRDLRVVQLAFNFVVDFEMLGLPFLQSLDISCNFIVHANMNHLLNHRSLVLIISNNSVGSSNTSLISGYNIYASNNNLRDFKMIRITPDSVGLDLSKNHISSIPNNTFLSASSLSILNLADNLIMSITSSSFSGLQIVHKMTLERNQLVYLPSGVFSHVQELKSLQLSGNPLTYLSDRPFMAIHGLLYLGLASMPLSNVSFHSLQDIQNVEYLNIDRNLAFRQFFINKTSVLSFMEFPNLHHISLSSNELGNHCPVLLMNDVGVVQLSDNLFTSIPKDCLPSARSAYYLSLSYNRIRSISKDSFEASQQFWELDLSHNHIASFEFGALQDQKYLAVLSLEGNQLTKLDVSSLTFSLKWIVMDLRDNPWSCDCGLILAVRMLFYWSGDNVVCRHPSEYSNFNLVELLVSDNFTCRPQLCSQAHQTLLSYIGDTAIEIPCPIITSKSSDTTHWSFVSQKQQPLLTSNNLPAGVSVLLHNALFIELVDFNLTGSYTCRSENGAGQTKFTVDLLVQEQRSNDKVNESIELAKSWKEKLPCGHSGSRTIKRSMTTMTLCVHLVVCLYLWQQRE